MINDKDQKNNTYSTLDSYIAGFLTLRGYSPKLVQKNGKVVFLFNADDNFYEDLADFNTAVVQASQFTFAIKTLKSQIHSMRRDEDIFYGKEKKGL